MSNLEGTWRVHFLHYSGGDEWLVEEGIADAETAMAVRDRYLSEHADLAQRGQAYVTAPAEPWKQCEGCGQPMVRVSGIPVCVGDFCVRGTGPMERGRIRRAVKGLVSA